MEAGAPIFSPMTSLATTPGDQPPRSAAVTAAPVRVLVVDDHEIVRHGVAALLDGADGIVVCGTAGCALEALDMTVLLAPDLVVMDVHLAEDCGIEAARAVRSRLPGTKVLMLTDLDEERAMFSSILAGASGYHSKRIAGSDLVAAVRAVAAGQSSVDPAMMSAVMERLRSVPPLQDEKLGRLSGQEERVLARVSEGKTNKEIAQELFISDKTVKNHVSHILAKLEVTRRSQAAAYVTRHRLD